MRCLKLLICSVNNIRKNNDSKKNASPPLQNVSESLFYLRAVPLTPTQYDFLLKILPYYEYSDKNKILAQTTQKPYKLFNLENDSSNNQTHDLLPHKLFLTHKFEGLHILLPGEKKHIKKPDALYLIETFQVFPTPVPATTTSNPFKENNS